MQIDRSAERVGRIGSADVPCIVGLNPWRSALACWQVITGREPSDDLSGELRVRIGQDLEGLGIEWYERETGRKADRVGTIAAPDAAHLTATPDAVDPSGRSIVEVKCTFARWPEPPAYYWCQTRWQALLCGLNDMPIDWLTIAVVRLGGMAPTVELHRRPFKHAEAEAERDQVVKWWSDYVDGDTAPPAAAESLRDGSAERQHRATGGAVVKADPGGVELLAQYSKWRQRREYAATQETEAKARLCDLIADAQGIEADGIGRATWYARKGRASVNRKAIIRAAEIDPDLIAEHTTITAGGRTFRWTAAKAPDAE